MAHRLCGLINTGAVKDRPLWMDIYEEFPPHVEPNFMRPEPKVNLRKILYPEDMVRAEFYKKYPSIGIIDLLHLDPKYRTPSQKFVERYNAISGQYEHKGKTMKELFDITEKELKREGFLSEKFVRQVPPEHLADPPPRSFKPKSQVSLQDLADYEDEISLDNEKNEK